MPIQQCLFRTRTLFKITLLKYLPFFFWWYDEFILKSRITALWGFCFVCLFLEVQLFVLLPERLSSKKHCQMFLSSLKTILSCLHPQSLLSVPLSPSLPPSLPPSFPLPPFSLTLSLSQHPSNYPPLHPGITSVRNKLLKSLLPSLFSFASLHCADTFKLRKTDLYKPCPHHMSLHSPLIFLLLLRSPSFVGSFKLNFSSFSPDFLVNCFQCSQTSLPFHMLPSHLCTISVWLWHSYTPILFEIRINIEHPQKLCLNLRINLLPFSLSCIFLNLRQVLFLLYKLEHWGQEMLSNLI